MSANKVVKMDTIYRDNNFEVSIFSETALLIKCNTTEKSTATHYESAQISVSLQSGLTSSFHIKCYPNHSTGFYIYFYLANSSTIPIGSFNVINEQNEEITLTLEQSSHLIGGNGSKITAKDWTRSDQTIWCTYNLTSAEKFNFPPTSDEHFLNKWLAKIEELNAYDIRFVIGGRVIKALKTLICAHSDVFSRMFDNDWKEKNGEIEIADIRYDVMAKFVDALHKNKIEQLEDPIFALKMKQVAHKYNVAFVEKYAERATIKNLAPGNIVEILSYAHEHHEDEILEASIKFFNKNVKSQYRDIPNVDKISPELCKLLLEASFDGQRNPTNMANK